jgi:hypothetical protein
MRCYDPSFFSYQLMPLLPSVSFILHRCGGVTELRVFSLRLLPAVLLAGFDFLSASLFGGLDLCTISCPLSPAPCALRLSFLARILLYLSR